MSRPELTTLQHSVTHHRPQDIDMAAPKITLYTNHKCPWAHRAHIALKELKLEFEEVIIDLTKPREPWYLEVNPVGSFCSCF